MPPRAAGRPASASATAVAQLERALPKVAQLLEDAEDDVLAFSAFRAEHWRKLRSTNPLERYNREIGRRTAVVGIFPDGASLLGWSSNGRRRAGPASAP